MDLFESLIGSKIIPSGGGGGGAALNIAYGQEAPSDTSKIWIKAEEPESLDIKLVNRSLANCSIETKSSLATKWRRLGLGFVKDGKYYAIKNYNTSSYSTFNEPHFISIDLATGVLSDIKNLNSSYGISSSYSAMGGFCWYDENQDIVHIFVDDASTGSSKGYYLSFYFTDMDNPIKNERVSSADYDMRTYTPSTCLIYQNYAYSFGASSSSYYTRLNLSTFARDKIKYTDTSIQPSLGCGYNDCVFFFDRTSGKICKYSILEQELYQYEVYSQDSISDICKNLYVMVTMDGVTLYGFCGYSTAINKIYVFKYDPNGYYSVSELDSTFSENVSINYETPGQPIIYKNTVLTDTPRGKISKLTFGWELVTNSAELYLSSGDGTKKSYLLNSNGIKQEVNSVKYFYGDSTGKAASAPVYYYNGTDWVEFT